LSKIYYGASRYKVFLKKPLSNFYYWDYRQFLLQISSAGHIKCYVPGFFQPACAELVEVGSKKKKGEENFWELKEAQV